MLLKDQAREQLDLTRQGQVADRFTRAVDQLGSRQETIRLGGIYGLETIAIQSPETRLLSYEVLTAFVRQRAKVQEHNPSEYLHDGSKLEDRLPDVHAAMTVLGRSIVLAADPPLNLRDVDLHGADLRKANLSQALLDRSNLNGANLNESQLENTHLVLAALRSTTFTDARAWRLDAHNSIFHDARFENAQLGGSNFEDSDLRWTRFSDASLEGANIKCTVLDGSDLGGAELGGASFHKSDLRGARLESTNLDGAWADRRTKWPAGFDANAAGVQLVSPEKSMNTHCESSQKT